MHFAPSDFQIVVSIVVLMAYSDRSSSAASSQTHLSSLQRSRDGYRNPVFNRSRDYIIKDRNIVTVLLSVLEKLRKHT